jgi:hypothetical protein
VTVTTSCAVPRDTSVGGPLRRGAPVPVVRGATPVGRVGRLYVPWWTGRRDP